MKGTAARPAYFQQVLTTISDLGATGVILEWEDMFPYAGKLARVKNGKAYSMQETIDILDHAQSLGLTIIPLIQTLGHLEWILKTAEYAEFRENKTYPMVMCIGDDRAQQVVLDIVNQLRFQFYVLSVHKKYATPYFHIGADEVYQIGECAADKTKLAGKYENNVKRMEFDYLKMIASNITNQSENTKVLAWFDEFKSANSSLIQEYSLNKLIISVVWKYTADLDKDLPLEMWTNLSHSFSSVWGASAFKGADGSARYWNRIKPYIQNNKAWFLQSVKYSDLFPDFQGMILTGWSRYDHFAGLCESMPVSMTSLALNIKIAQNFIILEKDVDQIIRILKCPPATDLNSMIAGTDKCRFPGYKVRDALSDFKQLKDWFDNATWIHNREDGWLQNSHRLLSASNPLYVDAIGKQYEKNLNKLEGIIDRIRMDAMLPTHVLRMQSSAKQLRTGQDFVHKKFVLVHRRSSMNEIFYSDVAEEFLIDKVFDFKEDLQKRLNSVRSIDSRNYHRPRPWFPVKL